MMNILCLVVCGLFLSGVWNEDVELPEIQQGTLCLNCDKSSTVEIACSTQERIGFEGIYYGGKDVQSCKSDTKFDCETSTPNCCIPDKKRDCITTVEKKGYYESCLGLVSCSITFTDDTMVCARDSSINKPNYAGISYYCIPETNFVYLEKDTTSRGKVVYIINSEYPTPLDTFTVYTCSVETKCGRTVSISALDMFLGYDSKKAECVHELTIQDNGESITKTCYDNNQMRRSSYYYSQSNFIILSFTSTPTSAQGYVWLEFTELNLKDNIVIICGRRAKQRPSACRENVDSRTKQPATTPSDKVTVDPLLGNSTDSLNSGESTLSEDDTSVKAISLGVVITVLAAVGVIAGVCYYKKRKESKINPDEEEVAPSTSSNTESETDPQTPPRRVLTRNRTRDANDEYDEDDDDHTERTTGDDWRTRRNGFVPPLKEYPSVSLKKNSLLRKLADRAGPPGDQVSLPQDTRRPLPKIDSRTRRKITPSDQ